MKINVLVNRDREIIAIQPLPKSNDALDVAGQPIVEPVPRDGEELVQVEVDVDEKGIEHPEKLFGLVAAQIKKKSSPGAGT